MNFFLSTLLTFPVGSLNDTRVNSLSTNDSFGAERSFVPVLSRDETFPFAGTAETRWKENFQTNHRHFPPAKRGGTEPKVGGKDGRVPTPTQEGSPNSFHGQLQLAFMPRFAYRCEIIP